MADAVVVTPAVVVKPWYVSPSLWVTAATIVAVIYESGLVPSDSPGYKILGLLVAAAMAMGLLTKRGLIEAQVVKANAIVEVAKVNPQPSSPIPSSLR